jgi:hypothetical protein
MRIWPSLALLTSKPNPSKVKRGKDDGPKGEYTADNKSHPCRRTSNWHEPVYDANQCFWNNFVDNRSEQSKGAM